MPWVSRLRVVSSPAAARSGGLGARASNCPKLVHSGPEEEEEEEGGRGERLPTIGRTTEEGRREGLCAKFHSPLSVVSAPLHCAFLIKREERARNIRLVNSPPPARILLSPSRTGCLWIGSYNLINLLKLGICPQILKQQQTPASYYPTLPNPRPVNLRSHRGIASEDGDDPIGGPAPRSLAPSFFAG